LLLSLCCLPSLLSPSAGRGRGRRRRRRGMGVYYVTAEARLPPAQSRLIKEQEWRERGRERLQEEKGGWCGSLQPPSVNPHTKNHVTTFHLVFNNTQIIIIIIIIIIYNDTHTHCA